MSKKANVTRRFKKADGTIVYVKDNQLHNFDGPALIPEGDEKKAEYYIFGIQHSKDEWLEAKKITEGLPWYKTTNGKQSNSRV